MSEQLNEVFDSAGTMPVVNLNLKSKVPQIWSIGDSETNLVARMVAYTSEGDAIKQVKMGDKYAHVILMSLSSKGAPAELKNGLGPQPIDALNTIFDTVYSEVKKLRMDAVMFRFPTKKMKGQGPVVQRVIQRLVMQKTGGKFRVIPALYNFSGKHTYVLVVRKSANIEDIKGLPGINDGLYTKVDSAVGDVFVDKETGTQVSKEEAVAGSIAKVEEKRSDKTVIARTKISRRQIAASQALSTDTILDPEKFEEYEATAAEFSKPADVGEIPEAQQIKDSVESKAARLNSANLAARGASVHLSDLVKMKLSQRDKFEDEFTKELQSRIGNASLTSVSSMQAYIQTLLDSLEGRKGEAFDHIKSKLSPMMSDSDKEKEALKLWNIERVKIIKASLQGYAKNVSEPIYMITVSRTATQYTNAEKRGIKEYVGSGYSDINNMLLGRYDENNYSTMTTQEVTKAIKNLDDAFKNGDRIPEGLTLWRAQTIRKPIYEALVKNRVFYFRNYVSTSLMPIIFGGWKGNLGVGMTSDNTRNVLNIDGGEEAIVPSQEVRLVQEYGEERIKVSVGWAIEGGDKINVVYPGDLSNMAGEMEVILPRGTMVKINKITDASYNDGIEYGNQKFIQAEIMTSDQMNESTVVYDGDVLMETGELVAMDSDIEADAPVSFASFTSSGINAESKRKALGILASLIDISDTPEKFVD